MNLSKDTINSKLNRAKNILLANEYNSRIGHSDSNSSFGVSDIIDVIDGDTVKVRKNGRVETLRLSSMNTPENDHIVNGKLQKASDNYAGDLARDELLYQLGLHSDTRFYNEGQDKYGRTLVNTFDKNTNKDIQENVIERGYANAFLDGKNPVYDQKIADLEQKARDRLAGLHGDHFDTMIERSALSRQQKAGDLARKLMGITGDNPFTSTVLAGASGALSGISDMAQFLGDEGKWSEDMSHRLSMTGEGLEKIQNKLNNGGFIDAAGYAVSHPLTAVSAASELAAQSAGYMLPSIAAGIATGGTSAEAQGVGFAAGMVPKVAQFVPSLMQTTQSLAESRVQAKGKTDKVTWSDKIKALPVATVHSALDTVSLDRILKTRGVGDIIKNVGVEGLTEGSQGVIEHLYQNAYTGQDVSAASTWKAFKDNAFMGMMASVPMSVASSSLKKSQLTDDDDKDIASTVNSIKTGDSSSTFERMSKPISDVKESSKNLSDFIGSYSSVGLDEDSKTKAASTMGELRSTMSKTITSAVNEINSLDNATERAVLASSMITDIDDSFNSQISEASSESKKLILEKIKQEQINLIKSQVKLNNFSESIEKSIGKDSALDVDLTPTNYRNNREFTDVFLRELDKRKLNDIVQFMKSESNNIPQEKLLDALSSDFSDTILGKMYAANPDYVQYDNGALYASRAGVAAVNKGHIDGVSRSDYWQNNKDGETMLSGFTAMLDRNRDFFDKWNDKSIQKSERAELINSFYSNLFGKKSDSSVLGDILKGFSNKDAESVYKTRQQMFDYFGFNRDSVSNGYTTAKDAKAAFDTIYQQVYNAHPSMSKKAISHAAVNIMQNLNRENSNKYASPSILGNTISIKDKPSPMNAEKQTTAKPAKAKEKPVAEKQQQAKPKQNEADNKVVTNVPTKKSQSLINKNKSEILSQLNVNENELKGIAEFDDNGELVFKAMRNGKEDSSYIGHLKNPKTNKYEPTSRLHKGQEGNVTTYYNNSNKKADTVYVYASRKDLAAGAVKLGRDTNSLHIQPTESGMSNKDYYSQVSHMVNKGAKVIFVTQNDDTYNKNLDKTIKNKDEILNALGVDTRSLYQLKTLSKDGKTQLDKFYKHKGANISISEIVSDHEALAKKSVEQQKETFKNVDAKNYVTHIRGILDSMVSLNKFETRNGNKVDLRIADLIFTEMSYDTFSSIKNSRKESTLDTKIAKAFKSFDIQHSGLINKYLYSDIVKTMAKNYDIVREDNRANIDAQIVKDYNESTVNTLTAIGVHKDMAQMVMNIMAYRYGSVDGVYSDAVYAKAIKNNNVLNVALSTSKESSAEAIGRSTFKSGTRIELAAETIFNNLTETKIAKDTTTLSFLHEIGHAIRNSLSKEEMIHFIDVFAPDLSDGSIDIKTEEAFAMAFTNMMINNQNTRDYIINHTSKNKNIKQTTIEKIISKVRDIFNSILDSLSKLLSSRGEFNKQFNDLQNMKAFDTFIKYIINPNEVDINSIVNSDIDAFHKAMDNVRNDIKSSYGSKQYSSVAGKYSRGTNFVKLQKFIRDTHIPKVSSRKMYNFRSFFDWNAWKVITLGTKRRIQNSEKYKSAVNAAENYGFTSEDFTAKMSVDTMDSTNVFFDRIEDILNSTNRKYRQDPERFKASVSKLIKEATNKFSTNEKRSLHRVINNAELFNLSDDLMNDVMLNIDNDAYLANKINSLGLSEDQLNDIMVMGRFMATHETPKDGKLIVNSKVMADYHNLGENDVKTAATIAAIMNTDIESRNDFLSAFKKDYEGLSTVIQYANHINNLSLDAYKANGESHLNALGSEQHILNKNQEMKYASSDIERDAIIANEPSYKVLYQIKNENDNTTHYVLSRNNLEARFKDGFIVNVNGGFNGIKLDPSASVSFGVPIYKFNEDRGEYVTDSQQLILPYSVLRENENLVENIVDTMTERAEAVSRYRYRNELNSMIRDTVSSDISQVSRTTDKDNAPIVLTNSLISEINREFGLTIKTSPDEMYKFLVRMYGKDIASLYKPINKNIPLPPEFKDAVFVRRDYADMAIGYREAMFGGGSSRAIRTLEVLLKDLVAQFNLNVVIKSPVALMNNIQFNLGILMAENKLLTPTGILKAPFVFRDLMRTSRGLSSFMSDLKQFTSLGFKLEATGKLSESEMKAYNKAKQSVKDSEYSEFMDMGFMQSIADNVINEEKNSTGLLGSVVEGAIDSTVAGINRIIKTNVSSSKTKSFLSGLYMTPESRLGSKFATIVQYSDYVFRIQYYKDLIKNGMSKDEAKSTALKSFVDYRKNLPSELQAVQEYGVIPFAGWQVRMFYALKDMAKRHPMLYAMMFMAMFMQPEPDDDLISQELPDFNPMSAFLPVTLVSGRGFPSLTDNAALDSNTVVPVIYENLWDGISGNPASLFRLFGLETPKPSVFGDS